MNEFFLQNCWKYKLLETNDLQTTLGEKVIIHDFGKHNLNEGPDFIHAKIEIASKIWFGSIEIHSKNSDWKNHKHDLNKNYETVILHLVYEMDVAENINNIPTIELKKYIPQQIIDQSKKLLEFATGFIPCEKEIGRVNESSKNIFLESLYLSKLEEKTKLIEKELNENLFHWEGLFFKHLAYVMGLKVNAEAFYNLASSIPFILIEKAAKNKWDLEALLLGQAGFLDENFTEEYPNNLKNTYAFYQHKYQLNALNKAQFKFFRLRPTSFPTIQIAQLAAIYKNKENIFSKITTINSIEDFYKFFENISISDYWNNHYLFDKKSSLDAKKVISKAKIDLLIINTIIPFKYAHQKLMGEENNENLIEIMWNIKPESNSIIKNFIDLKIKPSDAIQSQALLHLHKNFCTHKKCLSCFFGIEILKNS